MLPPIDAGKRLASLFEEQKCWMIDPLSKQMNYSIPSVRRALTKAGYFSSFTHNGRWYTLACVPRFSREGLWFYQDIGFSKAGSLTRTIVELATGSPAGISAEQLGAKLRCRCHTVLVQLYRQGRIERQRLGRSYVYLAADPDVAASQRQAMQKTMEIQALPAEISVLVLAEFIRHPKAGFKQLAKAISARAGVHIQAKQIQVLFDLHGLKKTP
jgi:hypothetical protein